MWEASWRHGSTPRCPSRDPPPVSSLQLPAPTELLTVEPCNSRASIGFAGIRAGSPICLPRLFRLLHGAARRLGYFFHHLDVRVAYQIAKFNMDNNRPLGAGTVSELFRKGCPGKWIRDVYDDIPTRLAVVSQSTRTNHLQSGNSGSRSTIFRS